MVKANHALSNSALDCNVITLGLDCNVMIQANFRRICMESSEQNIAYILLPFCTNSLIFSKWTFFILFFLDTPINPIISQI